jgi:hypothetical protein
MRADYRPYGFGVGWPATPFAAPSVTELGKRMAPPATSPPCFAPWFALSICDAHPQANSSPTAAIVEISVRIMVILPKFLLLSPDDVARFDVF